MGRVGRYNENSLRMKTSNLGELLYDQDKEVEYATQLSQFCRSYKP